MSAAPSIELVPIPLPFGTSAEILMSSPPPVNAKPVTVSALFTRAHQSDGSFAARISAMSEIVHDLPRSALSTLTSRSRRRRTRTFTGRAPFSVTAALKTVPPISMQIGGVSLHPPAKSILSGSSTSTHASCSLSASSFACSTFAISRESPSDSHFPSVLKSSSTR